MLREFKDRIEGSNSALYQSIITDNTEMLKCLANELVSQTIRGGISGSDITDVVILFDKIYEIIFAQYREVADSLREMNTE